MKKIIALLVALMLFAVSAAALAEDIVILVPNADHGWTGSVLTYAEEKAARELHSRTLADCIAALRAHAMESNDLEGLTS